MGGGVIKGDTNSAEDLGRDKKKNSTWVPRVEIANEYSSNFSFCVMILSSKKNPLSTE